MRVFPRFVSIEISGFSLLRFLTAAATFIASFSRKKLTGRFAGSAAALGDISALLFVVSITATAGGYGSFGFRRTTGYQSL